MDAKTGPQGTDHRRKPHGCLWWIMMTLGCLVGGFAVLVVLVVAFGPADLEPAREPSTTPTATQALDEGQLNAYCTYRAAHGKLIRDSSRRFDTDTVEGDREASEWRSAELKRLGRELLGEDYLKIVFQSGVAPNYWDHKCSALEQGKEFFGGAEADVATASDARLAMEALELHYIRNKAMLLPHFSAIDCDWETHNGSRFVGCRGKNIGGASFWELFVIGRNSDSNVLVSPLNGPALGSVEGVRQLSTVSGRPVAVAVFAGPSFDVSSIVDQF